MTSMSRRRLLTTVGLGGAAATAGILLPAPRAYAGGSGNGTTAGDPSTFGRLFPKLPTFAQPSAALTAALMDIGKPGGLLDAKDDLSVGPILLITDPNQSRVNRDNPTHSAGTTFVGQFLDHDITFDAVSALGVPSAPESTPNARSARIDLDSVYGGGPAVSPHLYADDHLRLVVESGGRFEDLPRRGDGKALIADPRNDSNLLIAGLHAAFLKLHNNVVDLLIAQHFDGDVFAEARRLV